MIKKISLFIDEISKTWAMGLSLLIMVFFMIFVLPGQAKQSGNDKLPDTTFLYSPGELIEMTDQLGAEGRQEYIHARWTFDLGFPLVYVGFLSIGISWFLQHLRKTPPGSTLTNILPIMAGLFDYLENCGASLVMGNYPDLITGLPTLTSLFSGVKWSLVGSSFLVYFFLAGALFVQWIKNLSQN